MDQYGLPSHIRAPVPPVRVSSLSSSRTMSSVGGHSSEASSMRSGRSGLSLESGHRTSQESTKPRLSKDQQEYLERQYAQHPKPNTQTKKGFANDLNVPLEKINNWFQNRRAKSKQDAKKKQNSYSHFATHPLVSGHHPIDQAYIDQAFYHTAHPQSTFLPSWQPPVLPGNSIEPSVSTNNAQFGLELDLPNHLPSQEIPHHMGATTAMHDDPTARGFEPFFGFSAPNNPIDSQAMDMYQRQFFIPESFPLAMDTIPEYDIPDASAHSSQINASMPDEPLTRQNTLGSEELSNSIPYPPRNGDLPMPPSSDFFHPIEVHHETYTLPTWGQFAGRPLEVRSNSVQQATSPHSESQLPYRSINAPYQSNPSSTLYRSPTAGPTFADRAQNKNSNDMELQDRPSVTTSQNLDVPLTGVEVGRRRDSTMTRLVESIDHVQVEPHVLEKKASQQSIGHPSLATRRQRKPAPIGTAGVRSSSFSSTNPSSPKTTQSYPSEKELRRIKSSIGVMNGRVQKSSLAGSAQRSPLSFTFSDAAASVRNSKSMSSRSMTSLSVDTVSRSNSLVPVTPISPPEDDMHQLHYGSLDKSRGTHADISATPDDSVWANMPNTSDTTTESIWSSSFGSNGTDAWVNFHSPPGTPLQPPQGSYAYFQSNHKPQQAAAPSTTNAALGWQQQQQFPNSSTHRAYQSLNTSNKKNQFTNLDSKKTSDDAKLQILEQHHISQQQFDNSAPHLHQLSESVDSSAMQEEASGHSDRDRYQNHEQTIQAQSQQNHQSPTHNHGIRSESRPEGASVTPQPPTTSIQSPQRTDQFRQSGLNMFHVGDPDLRNLEPGQLPSNLIQVNTTPPRVPQELVIQHFSPRDPVPTERMPPRARTNEMPKSFEFQMCGPENFSSP